jgi:hypothetical protein
MSCNYYQLAQNILNTINGRINYLENIVNSYFTQNYKLTTASNVNVLFSKTNQGQNYLNILFNGTLDSSIQDYVFTYSFKNTEPHDSVLGSIFFQNKAFPAKQYIKIINNPDGVTLIIRIPDITLLSSEQVFQFDIVLNDDSSTSNTYPCGFEINGYFLWESDFVGSPVTQYYCQDISAAQTSYQAPSNAETGSSTYTYNGNTSASNIPSGINSIFLFSGYSNAATALSNSSSIYNVAYDYLTNLGTSDFLISLCLGGGNSNGGWDTGSSGAIYSIYQAATNNGVAFSYTETGTGATQSGTGTGILNNTYNSLLFDIETWTGSSGSTGIDFINLFNYLKNNANSTFYGFKCIIIVSIAHSCSNFNGTGQSVVSTLLSDSTGSYDYINNQMYTQNVGTTNEYCANYNILWTGTNGFAYYLSQNSNYSTYGNYFILPAINFPDLYTGPGTNTTGYPNLYFYQSSSNNTSTLTETASGYITIPYTEDTGVTGFFQAITGSTTPLGGYIQWVNGTLS